MVNSCVRISSRLARVKGKVKHWSRQTFGAVAGCQDELLAIIAKLGRFENPTSHLGLILSSKSCQVR